MAGLSDTWEKKLLDAVFKQTDIDASVDVPALYIALHTADPGDNGANELAASGGYAREQLDPDPNNSTHTNWNEASAGGTGSRQITNATAVTFDEATSDWNSAAAILYFGLWTADSGGTFIGGGQLNGSSGVIVLDGNILSFPAGNLHFSVA